VVLLDDALYMGSGRFLARVQLDEAGAVWRDQPRELTDSQFRRAAALPSGPPHTNGLHHEIVDVMALLATRLRVHAVGKAAVTAGTAWPIRCLRR
jgi:hypothetical protein